MSASHARGVGRGLGSVAGEGGHAIVFIFVSEQKRSSVYCACRLQCLMIPSITGWSAVAGVSDQLWSGSRVFNTPATAANSFNADPHCRFTSLPAPHCGRRSITTPLPTGPAWTRPQAGQRVANHLRRGSQAAAIFPLFPLRPPRGVAPPRVDPPATPRSAARNDFPQPPIGNGGGWRRVGGASPAQRPQRMELWGQDVRRSLSGR